MLGLRPLTSSLGDVLLQKQKQVDIDKVFILLNNYDYKVILYKCDYITFYLNAAEANRDELLSNAYWSCPRVCLGDPCISKNKKIR